MPKKAALWKTIVEERKDQEGLTNEDKEALSKISDKMFKLDMMEAYHMGPDEVDRMPVKMIRLMWKRHELQRKKLEIKNVTNGSKY